MFVVSLILIGFVPVMRQEIRHFDIVEILPLGELVLRFLYLFPSLLRPEVDYGPDDDK